MKSIWYFVGLLLTVIGILITVSGIFTLLNPPPEPKLLAHLHPDLWWGLLMMAFGLFFALWNRNKTVE
jgi:hypothetical protein